MESPSANSLTAFETSSNDNLSPGHFRALVKAVCSLSPTLRTASIVALLCFSPGLVK